MKSQHSKMKRCPQCNRVETDEALKFCRVDGATLISDSSSIESEARTARLGSSAENEIETNIVLHRTDADVVRAPAGTRVRPQAASSTTGKLTSIHRRKLAAMIGVIVVAAAGTIAIASLYLSRQTTAGVQSIAVLPLVNQSGNADAEYLSDGLTESIINSLSQLPRLKVMARSTVFRFKGRESDPLAVGKELGVQAVLTGRVLQRGDSLIVSAELVNVSDGTQLWGGQYNREAADLLSVQQSIAKEISEKMQLKLTGESENRLAKRYTDNVEAYRLYLRGRYEFFKFTPEGINKSIEFYNQAIAIDASYALAYTGLSSAYGMQGNSEMLPPKEAYAKAKWAAEKALAIDDQLSEAHEALATVKLFEEWDWPAAEKELKRALELNPNNASAHVTYGNYFKVMARTDEEMAEVRRGLELDPLSSFYNMELTQALYLSRRYDEAIAQAQKAIALDPQFPITYYDLGDAYEQKGMFREAIAAFQRGQEISGEVFHDMTLASLASAYWHSGQHDKAQKAIDELLERSKQRYVPAYWLALAYVAIGNKDQAFAWLDKAYEERFFLLMWIKPNPRFDAIRSDPRYLDLMRRMRLEP
jgi:eukaryotic-like serine/threonine-protein kinase